jgi:hypothetical protein
LLPFLGLRRSFAGRISWLIVPAIEESILALSLKLFRFLRPVVAAVAFLAIGFFVKMLLFDSGTPPPPPGPVSGLSHDFEMIGLNYAEYLEGGGEVRFKADRVVMRKKRFGFFTTGLLNLREILVNNASLDIHFPPTAPKTRSATGEPVSLDANPETACYFPIMNRKKEDRTAEARDLNPVMESLRRALSPDASDKGFKVVRIEIDSLEISFYEGRNLISSLRAERGIFKEGEFLFAGNVVFRKNQGKTVKTRTLAWSTKDRIFSTDDICVVTSADRDFIRNGMTFNLFLEEQKG